MDLDKLITEYRDALAEHAKLCKQETVVKSEKVAARHRLLQIKDELQDLERQALWQ